MATFWQECLDLNELPCEPSSIAVEGSEGIVGGGRGDENNRPGPEEQKNPIGSKLTHSLG